jgi:hypothetical protein
VCTTAAAAALLGLTPAAQGEWLFQFNAGAVYDSNLTGAAKAVDIRPGWAAAAEASASQFYALSGDDGLTLTVNLRGELYDRYDGLDFAAIGASARYRHKFGVGRDVPSLSLVVDTLYGDYQSSVRDGARFDVRAEVSVHPSETVEATAGVGYDRRYGPHGVAIVPGYSGEVFSLAGRSAYVRVDWSPDDRWLVGINGAVRRGDVESTSQQGLPVFLASTAIAPDPAFKDPNLFAYRLPGTTWALGAKSSYAPSDDASFTLQYAYAYTDSPQQLRYRSNVVGILYAHRF